MKNVVKIPKIQNITSGKIKIKKSIYAQANDYSIISDFDIKYKKNFEKMIQI